MLRCCWWCWRLRWRWWWRNFSAMLILRARVILRAFYFSGDFLAEIVQNTHFDTRLCAPEGKLSVPCLAVFFICAGSAFVHLFNQARRLSLLGDFGSQPRVKVGFLYNIAQYFCRKLELKDNVPVRSQYRCRPRHQSRQNRRPSCPRRHPNHPSHRLGGNHPS